jgi:excisionase family DNA binding protein
MLTTKEVADRLGLAPRSVVQLIRRKLIAAEKRGRDWFINAAEVERYAKERKPAHRPAHQ